MIPVFGQAGDDMIYLDRNGHESQRELARKFFSHGEVYQISRAEIGNSSSSYFFEGIPYGFNSVMFEFADIDKIIQETNEEREQRRAAYQASLTYQEFPQILGMVPPRIELLLRPIEELKKPAPLRRSYPPIQTEPMIHQPQHT